MAASQDCSMAETASGAEALTEDASEEKVPVTIEVCLKHTRPAPAEEVRAAVERFLKSKSLWYRDGQIPVLPGEEPYLESHVESITVCDTGSSTLVPLGARLLFWQVALTIHIFQLDESGAADDDGDEEDGAASYREWLLPSREFHGMWEHLVYDSEVKPRLLRYAATALRFSEADVSPHVIAWNRVVLLHGPPGTGKTSLCKALAHKLAVRFGHRYAQGQLIEVNAHSLFSKWFSESGKLVARLFARITEVVEEGDSLVFVLVDEVESLTAARSAAVSGSEPADAVRAVNALLTQLDALRRFPNVMVLTTSNLAGAIDVAFVDRADIKAYIGPPGLRARYDILLSCVRELQRVRLVARGPSPLPYADLLTAQEDIQAGVLPSAETTTCVQLSTGLLEAARGCEGLSGRALRKLPFLAHAGDAAGQGAERRQPCSCASFLVALKRAAAEELADRAQLLTG